MKTFEYDFRYLKAGLDVIEAFLLSDDIFWPVSAVPPEGSADYPRLTLGSMLLSKQRLAAYPVAGDQDLQRQQVISDLDRIRSKWRAAWEKKAGRSYGMRLHMWGDYLEEYKNNPQDNANRYAYEVRLRAMLSLLGAEAAERPAAEVSLLNGFDGYLLSVFVKGGFIWEPEVQNGFPVSVYWYLYGRISSHVV